jgi:hypothetical protein
MERLLNMVEQLYAMTGLRDKLAAKNRTERALFHRQIRAATSVGRLKNLPWLVG